MRGKGAVIGFVEYVLDHYDRLLELSLEHLAVVLVGVAALGPIVGGPGLGELIFSGLRVITSPNAVNLALMGTLGVVLVGMLLDGAFQLLSRLTTSRGLR